MSPNDVLFLIENMGNAERKNRLHAANYVLNNPESFQYLLELTFDIHYKKHFKAAWVLEFVLEKKLNWLFPHLDFFTNNLNLLKNESSIRVVSKICMWLSVSYIKKNESETLMNLTKAHIHKIVESGFDWMINDTNVASKAYTMDTLYFFGTLKNYELEWVHQELKNVILLQMSEGSPGFIGHAKKILERI